MQWESLAHRGARLDVHGNARPEPVDDNGYRAGEYVVMDPEQGGAAKSLGIERMAAHDAHGRSRFLLNARHCAFRGR